MHDRQSILVSDVPVELRVGVPESERACPQRVLVSVGLEMFDPPHYARTDRLSETVDYDGIIGFIQTDLPKHGEIRLIETVADLIAAHALSASPRVAWVDVTVKKPAVLGAAGLVSVSLRRHGHKATHKIAAILDEESARAEARL
jgi:dihydroneopterin aldolase